MAGALTHMIASIFSGSAVVPDPYFEYTTLLLPGNGTNGAQNNTFLDGSTNNFTITRNGNTTQGTFSPFSQTGWGNYFSSANLSCPNINFTTNAFCIEGWYYFTDVTTQNINLWGTTNGGGTVPKINLIFNYQYNSNLITFDAGSFGSNILGASNTYITNNAWNHIAVVREGTGTNQTKLYINGTLRSSGTLSGNLSTITGVFNIAYIGEAFGTKFPGYISNFRVVNGSAVYTSDFTPSTTPLTAITNTALLTCQANRFIDSNTQTTAKTITVTGSPQVVAFSPFNPTSSWSAATNGGSGYFDGNTDYLSVADNSNLRLGTNAFTIQGWVYRNASGAAHSIVAKGGASTGFVLQITSTNILRFTHGTTNVDTTTTIPAFAWTHVAAVRTNTSTNGFQLYINGVSSATATVSTDFNQTNTLYAGADRSAANVMNGFISGLKYTNGTAESIAVPTEPPTATTNVALLLNFTNAGIYDATSKNDLETVGSTAISTAQSQFGGSSILFSSSYLSYPVQSFTRIGAGDYTFECWVRPSNVSTLQALLSFGSGAFRVFISGTNFWFLNSSSSIIGQVTNVFPTANVWYWVVLVRQGSATNNTAAYVNGTRIGQATNTTDFNAGSPTIGSEGAGSYLAGYMQDVRLTQYARYSPASSSITVPTAAFPTL